MSHEPLNDLRSFGVGPLSGSVAVAAEPASDDPDTRDAAVPTAADRARVAAKSEVIAVCGLPAVGKTFLSAALADHFTNEGRKVSVLGWDSVRVRIEAVHGANGEGGQASEQVRRLAGLWARREIGRWARERSPGDRLIIEAPLIGHRFSELAWVDDDDAEPLLARTLFIVPVPTPETRNRLISMRQADHVARGARSQDASVAVIESVWEEMRAAARMLRVGDAEGYSSDLYRRVYLHALKHRAALPVTVDRLHSPSPRRATPREHVPSSEEVLALANSAGESLRRTLQTWYAPESPPA